MYKQNLSFISKILKQKRTALVFVTLAVLFFSLSLPVFAATDFGLGYGTYLGLGTQDIRVTVMNIVRIFLGFIGIIAIILVIYAGFLWMTSAGNEEKISKAKEIMKNAVIGLIIILSAFAIVSFIIAALTGALGGGNNVPGPVPPPNGCQNCDYLGSGIIESVYPLPMQTNVARDTAIIVTFKEEIKPETVMDVAAGVTCVSGATNPCANKNIAITSGQPNVKIYKRADGETTALTADKVLVSTTDKKTYTFIPVGPLGDETAKNWYTTKLTENLKKQRNNEIALNGGFSWDFEIGTALDLEPPTISSVFPIPDNNFDSYQPVQGAKATGSIAVSKIPNVERSASARLGAMIVNSTSAQVRLSGNYNGTYDGTLTVTVGSGKSKLNVSSWNPALTGAATSFDIDSATRTATLGNGITVAFQDNNFVDGMQFEIIFIPKTDADILQVGDKSYKFIGSGTPATNEILIAGTPGSTNAANRETVASRISDKIQTQVQYPDVDSAVGTDTKIVNLTASLAGVLGNMINIGATGSWATIGNMTGGSDQTTSAQCSGPCDQPRNAVIRMDLSEAMLPTLTAGKAEVTTVGSVQGVGNLNSDTFNNILVQADINGDGAFSSSEYVNGSFVQSNQYKTIEFVSLQQCKDANGSPIINSCGDPIYCLPVAPGQDYIKYRVTIKAARLRNCTSGDNCTGLKYPNGTGMDSCLTIPKGANAYTGQNLVCGNTDGKFYMKADAGNPAGLTDVCNNSLDSSENGYTQGPLSQSLANGFKLNTGSPVKICDSQADNAGTDCSSNANLCTLGGTARPASCREPGDDLVWDFYIRNKIDINAPVMLGINPNIAGAGASLISPIDGKFNKLLQSSTVKPGTGYLDGKCTCNTNNDCQDSDQECKLIGTSKYCVNKNNTQVYCAKDNECKQSAGSTCETKKYVSLYDSTTQRVGWWISNVGEDVKICLNDAMAYKDCSANSDCGTGGVCGQKDSYFDRCIARIDHTRFLESTQYDAEVASGVKDIYQNCFVPGKGPNGQVRHCSVTVATTCTSNSGCPTGEVCIGTCEPYSTTGCCGVNNTSLPFCCNGLAQGTACTQ